MKKHLIFAFALGLSGPVYAEDDKIPDLLKQFEELSEQAKTALEGMVEDLGPTLEELGPALEGLADKIGDLSLYEPPEVLENGDILIRRKKPKPAPSPEPEQKPAELPPVKESIDL